MVGRWGYCQIIETLVLVTSSALAWVLLSRPNNLNKIEFHTRHSQAIRKTIVAPPHFSAMETLRRASVVHKECMYMGHRRQFDEL